MSHVIAYYDKLVQKPLMQIRLLKHVANIVLSIE